MKRKILVVDDEKDIVEILRYNLTKEGYEVITAFNGKDALQKISESIDLVVLDVMMPEIDGLELCKRIKANPSTAKIPVIFLTTRDSEFDEVLGLELGAD
ncbi:MAG: response regulator, partial [Ignavibacteria bacterium]|nr:response regulator [Ignavibacteria bacterium]